MIKTDSRIIDGDEYTVTALGARAASKLWYRLVGIIGATVGQLGGDMKLNSIKAALGSVGLSNFSDAINMLMTKLSENDLEKIMAELFWSLKKTGRDQSTGEALTFDMSKPGVFDGQLSGQVMTVGKLVAFALEVNFADFFDAMRAQWAKGVQEKAAKAAALSSPESTT